MHRNLIIFFIVKKIFSMSKLIFCGERGDLLFQVEAAASVEEVALSSAGCGSALPGTAKKVLGLLNTT